VSGGVQEAGIEFGAFSLKISKSGGNNFNYDLRKVGGHIPYSIHGFT